MYCTCISGIYYCKLTPDKKTFRVFLLQKGEHQPHVWFYSHTAWNPHHKPQAAVCSLLYLYSTYAFITGTRVIYRWCCYCSISGSASVKSYPEPPHATALRPCCHSEPVHSLCCHFIMKNGSQLTPRHIQLTCYCTSALLTSGLFCSPHCLCKFCSVASVNSSCHMQWFLVPVESSLTLTLLLDRPEEVLGNQVGDSNPGPQGPRVPPMATSGRCHHREVQVQYSRGSTEAASPLLIPIKMCNSSI